MRARLALLAALLLTASPAPVQAALDPGAYSVQAALDPVCDTATFCSSDGAYWYTVKTCYGRSGWEVDVDRQWCGTGSSCDSWRYFCAGSLLKKTRTCSDRGCDDLRGCTLLSSPRTQTVKDCGSGTLCGDWSYYCSGDTVRRTRTCTLQGCQDGACIRDTATEDEAVESCGNATTCSPWALACDGDAVVQQRTCTVRGCRNGACTEDTATETLPVETCGTASGCTDWETVCVGEERYRRRTCTQGGCLNGACVDNPSTEQEFVESCATETVCGAWSFFCSGSEQWERRTCSTGACIAGACATASADEERFVQDCRFGCSDGFCRPNPVLSASPTRGQAALPVSLDASASEPGTPSATLTSFSWDFGDGQTASEPSLVHTFSQGGTYNVLLTVTDSEGGRATTSAAIEVEDAPGLLSLNAQDVPAEGGQTKVSVEAAASDPLLELSVYSVTGGGENEPVPGLTGIRLNASAFPTTLGPFNEPGVYLVTADIVEGDCVVCHQQDFFTVAAGETVQTVPDAALPLALAVLAGALLLLARSGV